MPAYHLILIGTIFMGVVIFAFVNASRIGRLAEAQADVTRCFAICADAGVGPDKAIETILLSPPKHSGVAAGLRRVHNRMEDEGASFVTASVVEPVAVPREIVELYNKGDATVTDLGAIATKHEERADTTRSIRSAMLYPTVMLAIFGTLMLGFSLALTYPFAA